MTTRPQPTYRKTSQKLDAFVVTHEVQLTIPRVIGPLLATMDIRGTRHIPSELLHKIIIGIIADSVHAISMDRDVSEWHYGVISTLYAVNFSFQEISREIACKTFAIKGE
jgi:hypothetical protein